MTDWQDALKKAASTKTWGVGLCDNFVAEMWGESGSGYDTALDNWNASPGKVQGGEALSSLAPAGALYYWGGGDGHVAISAGDGTVYSTDIGGPGTVTRVPFTEISQKWNKPFLGWAPPFFDGKSPGATGPTSDTAGGKSIIDQILGSVESLPGTILGAAESALSLSLPSSITDFFTSTTDDITDVVSFLDKFFQPATYVRIGAGVFALIILIAAGFFLVREASKEIGGSGDS